MPTQFKFNHSEGEKLRIRLKMDWEGGLMGYLGYGIPYTLEHNFPLYFSILRELDRKHHGLYNKKQRLFIEDVSNLIEMYLRTENDEDTFQGDLNDYNYILSTDPPDLNKNS